MAQRRVAHLCQCIQKHGKELDNHTELKKLIATLEKCIEDHSIKTWTWFGLIGDYIAQQIKENNFEITYSELKAWIMNEVTSKQAAQYTNHHRVRGGLPTAIEQFINLGVLKSCGKGQRYQILWRNPNATGTSAKGPKSQTKVTRAAKPKPTKKASK
ncbi:MAG: hypothetical protein R3C05_09415 [Pirellulaceae bacterium]